MADRTGGQPELNMASEKIEKVSKAKTVSTGIPGVWTKIIDNSIVQLEIYRDTPITIPGGGLAQIGSTVLPAEVRPPSNLNYLLFFARANNAAAVLGVRVNPEGQMLGYNMNTAETTFTSVYGVALYSLL